LNAGTGLVGNAKAHRG